MVVGCIGVGMEAQQIAPGDKVRVYIKNNAPIGGDTQLATFTAETVTDTEIRGTDEAWGDECVISGLDTDTPEYSDAGKSGVVDHIEA